MNTPCYYDALMCLALFGGVGLAYFLLLVGFAVADRITTWGR